VAIITGGDSGSAARLPSAFAKEGAHISVVYLEDKGNANETKCLVEEQGGNAFLIKAMSVRKKFCPKSCCQTVEEFWRSRCRCNNAAEQHPRIQLKELPKSKLERTFRTNIFGSFSW